jgi:hypothetical protein
MDLLSVGTYFNYRKERKDDRITRHDRKERDKTEENVQSLSREYTYLQK